MNTRAGDAALASFLNVQTARQIAGAVTGGINTYAAHLDRSGIVNAMGGGDVMGTQIDELHRSAAGKSSLRGSVGRIGDWGRDWFYSIRRDWRGLLQIVGTAGAGCDGTGHLVRQVRRRGTGAGRGALAGFRSRTERFGGVSDGLNTAWQGNQAIGMSPAQFNEYLRAMQKTFEDGISKGFVRGADEIAGNFSFLSNLNGGSELWKGEQGAARLSRMNAGIEATTALGSVSDILSFRGAQNLLKQWDAQGDAEERWKVIGGLDPKKNGLELRRGYDYIDAMAILERGLTPELFHSQMQMIEGAGGVGNRTGVVEQMKNIYGLNYTGSAALYQSYRDKLETFNGDKEEAKN